MSNNLYSNIRFFIENHAYNMNSNVNRNIKVIYEKKPAIL